MDVDNATLIFINSISLRSFQKPHMIHIYLIYNSCFVSYQLHPRDPYSPISYPQFQYTRYFLGTFAHFKNLLQFLTIIIFFRVLSKSINISGLRKSEKVKNVQIVKKIEYGKFGIIIVFLVGVRILARSCLAARKKM